MLSIKKSRVKEEWIVFNTDNFSLHTHCRSQRVAVAIKRTVEHHDLPKSKDTMFVDSCIRVTSNRAYLRRLEAYKQSLKGGDNHGRKEESRRSKVDRQK